MKVYALTTLGKDIAKRGVQGDPDEMRIINHLKNYKRASDDELEKISELWIVRKLEGRGIVKELTQ